MSTATQPIVNEPGSAGAAGAGRSPRLWPGIVLLALFWTAWFIVARIDKPYFIAFIYNMAAPALLLILFSIWWWTNRRIPLADRVFGAVTVVALGVAVAPFCHQSIWFGLPTEGLPRALTVLTLWALLVKWTGFSWNRLGLVVLLGLSWGYYTLIRVDGLDSTLKGDISWRWTPTAEELFLAQKAQERARGIVPQLPESGPALTLSDGDWPAFRGEDREGVIRGVRISADWDRNPPKLLWRQRVGPAWSSVIVIGNRLFTQEQRGEVETVVCYQASTGKELWVHEDTCRFWETVSGAGPRATPTFARGRLFTLGATGILNCLDASTGKRYWSTDVTDEAPAKPPMWGYSSSPLVVDDRVIVFAGGKGDRNLLAFDTQTGYRKWAAPASHDTYSSPQLVTIDGQRHCLLLGDRGLTAVDPDTGAVLWEHGREMPGAPRAVQAHRIGR